MNASAFRSRVYRALDYDFTLEVVASPDLERHVRGLLDALPEGTEDAHRWLLRPCPGDTGDWELVADGERVVATATAAGLVVKVVHLLNDKAITSWRGVTCHAGGVERDGAAVVLPADPESGKTTLTTGLVRSGFRYVTDEAVAFQPGTRMIAPYPKPLSIDPGSWHLFPELEPHADLGSDDYKAEQWQVPPSAIRPGAIAAPCRAQLVVFPKYVDGATTELVPVHRAEALVELAKNTFAFNRKSRSALEALAGVVRGVQCYRLTVGELDAAVALVDELAASTTVGDDDDG